MKTKVTRNGQMTIPSHLREKYGIKEGSIIFIEDEGGGIKIKISDWIESEAGSGNYSIEGLKKDLDKESESWG